MSNMEKRARKMALAWINAERKKNGVAGTITVIPPQWWHYSGAAWLTLAARKPKKPKKRTKRKAK